MHCHCVIVVITVFIALVSLLYFQKLFRYSAIQPQVCNRPKLSVFSVFKARSHSTVSDLVANGCRFTSIVAWLYSAHKPD